MKNEKQDSRDLPLGKLALCPKKCYRWLHVKTGQLSQNSKLTICVLCCLGFGGYCGWLVLGGLSGKAAGSFAISQIKLPANIGKPAPAAKTIISEREYEKVVAYLDYLDDLKTSRQGRAVYDSLLALRPGLQDSLLMIHQMYLRQP
jgi:hypothetical protein